MHPSPNLLRSTVMGCEAKYELTKKRCQGGIFWSEIEVFGEEKWGHICYIADFRQNRVLKRSSEISGGKMDFFPKRSFENFRPTPKSAPSLCQWAYLSLYLGSQRLYNKRLVEMGE